MRILMALRTGWRVLTDAGFAAEISTLAAPQPTPVTSAQDAPDAATKPQAPAPPRRSDALTLLASLQREARFVDMVKEPLENYSDAQIGAAARDVLRDCGQVLDRMFQLRPVEAQDGGAAIAVPKGYDTGCYRLSGQVAGAPPYHGRLVHHGWQAERCELPQWTGSAAAHAIVAPAEVEVGAPPQGGGA